MRKWWSGSVCVEEMGKWWSGTFMELEIIIMRKWWSSSGTTNSAKGSLEEVVVRDL